MLAADLMDRLIDYLGGDSAGDKAVRMARTAIQDALRAFPTDHTWRYFNTWARIALSAPYSTGTVAFNASTNALTLSSGTWPSWAASGHVRIGDLTATVATRVSDTVLTLNSNITFPENIASGTSYQIVREQYDLPANFSSADAYILECPFGTMQYVHPQDWLAVMRSQLGITGWPAIYTFAPSSTAGRYALRIWPPASDVQTLDYFYQRRMTAIQNYNVTDGKVSLTSGSATVTGAGTLFRSNMVGSTLRVSGNAKLPTGVGGVNPAYQEYTISAVGSTTSLTISSNATDTVSSAPYVISDPIDIEDGAMALAFQRLAIKQMAIDARMKDLESAVAAYNEAKVEAREADARNFARSTVGSRPVGIGRRIFYTALGPDSE